MVPLEQLQKLHPSASDPLSPKQTSIRTLESNSKAITMSKAKQQNYKDKTNKTNQRDQRNR